MEFFTTSTRNLLKYSAAAGVGHYVALSVVGTERILDSPYLRAKNAQESLIRSGGIPYSIVHATQFFEFINRIADEATDGKMVRLPSVLIQPMAADDVATAVARVAVGAPLNGTVEVAGPQQFRFDELIRQGLGARPHRAEGEGRGRARGEQPHGRPAPQRTQRALEHEALAREDAGPARHREGRA